MALETLDSTRNSKTAGAQPAVRITGLRKSFDGRLVLGGIDLDVPVGRIVSIIGQSGGGKTTLMRCVNLLERPDGGTIAIGEETIFANGGVTCRDLAKLRQRVGMVFQRFNLFPHLTAVEERRPCADARRSDRRARSGRRCHVNSDVTGGRVDRLHDFALRQLQAPSVSACDHRACGVGALSRELNLARAIWKS